MSRLKHAIGKHECDAGWYPTPWTSSSRIDTERPWTILSSARLYRREPLQRKRGYPVAPFAPLLDGSSAEFRNRACNRRLFSMPLASPPSRCYVRIAPVATMVPSDGSRDEVLPGNFVKFSGRILGNWFSNFCMRIYFQNRGWITSEFGILFWQTLLWSYSSYFASRFREIFGKFVLRFGEACFKIFRTSFFEFSEIFFGISKWSEEKNSMERTFPFMNIIIESYSWCLKLFKNSTKFFQYLDLTLVIHN